MSGPRDFDRLPRQPLSRSDREILSAIVRHAKRREQGEPALDEDLLAVAAEFGDASVAKLRTVRRIHEALRGDDEPKS